MCLILHDFVKFSQFFPIFFILLDFPWFFPFFPYSIWFAQSFPILTDFTLFCPSCPISLFWQNVANFGRLKKLPDFALIYLILPILPDFTQFYATSNNFFSILFNFSWFYRIRPDSVRLCPLFFRLCQILLELTRFFHILSDYARFCKNLCWILPNCAKHCYILQALNFSSFCLF